ncbi:amidohydrolase family protein [Sphaerisporangium sp. B11E5]|uniref:amidohydrolase family protein n=1 Tax=Sphaerisporangium sp. B11E5 TaxID=3153563 RepID=UPI00325EF802
MGEQMIALADLLTRGDGLPEGLRVVMLESGVGWIPPYLERLDGHVRRLGPGRATPSALFAEHVAVAPDPGERYAAWAVRELGTGNVVFGSDYPHWDTVRADEWLAEFGDLCPRDTLRANTRRFVPRLAQAPGRVTT